MLVIILGVPLGAFLENNTRNNLSPKRPMRVLSQSLGREIWSSRAPNS